MPWPKVARGKLMMMGQPTVAVPTMKTRGNSGGDSPACNSRQIFFGRIAPTRAAVLMDLPFEHVRVFCRRKEVVTLLAVFFLAADLGKNEPIRDLVGRHRPNHLPGVREPKRYGGSRGHGENAEANIPAKPVHAE